MGALGSPSTSGVESLDDGAPRAGRVRRASAIGAAGGEIDQQTEQRVQAARRGGAPLEPTVRRSMESAFGEDLGAVRVHQGSESAQLNDSMQANAFTLGSDVFVRDPLDTTSGAGLQLLAHELTHVVQQGAGRVRRSSVDMVRRHSVKDAPPAPEDVEKVQEDPDPTNPTKKVRRQMIRRDLTDGPTRKPPPVIHMDGDGVGHDTPDRSKAPAVIHMDGGGVGHAKPDGSKTPPVIFMDPGGVGHTQPDQSNAPPVLFMDQGGVGHAGMVSVDKALLHPGETAKASYMGTPAGPVRWSVAASAQGAATGTTISKQGKITAGPGATADEQQLVVTATPKSDPTGKSAVSTNVPLRSAAYAKALVDFPAFVSGGPYALPNYRTANGFGRFDAAYDPASKTLGIDMRIKFIFPEDKKGFLERKKTKLKREVRHQKYISKFITHVEGAWSRKFQFENQRAPKSVWSQLNPVDVDIRVTPVSTNEHFLANINTKSKGTANVSHSGKLTMFKGSDEAQEAMTDITKSGELQRLTKASPDMLFDAGTDNLTTASKKSTDFLGTYVARLHNPPVTLTIQGHGSSTALGKKRGDAVKAALTARGVAAPHALIVAPGAKGAKARATIKASLPDSFKNTQDVSAHEFGHMIGLDDEYATGATPSGAPIETYGRTKAAFGEDVADQTQLAGIDSASIMDGGDDVRIYHYVTLWDVLNQVTTQKAVLPTPVFGEADWKFIG